ncbi:hypothetical protein [Paenisporosarcina sp. TG20]|uniref:hypothetical protein n=1 Tax=Paenisporosarcina sp. TG20 TaxID=1211706 RepID=UPI0002EA2136|nr:hypothetical protein [Paenisporosarcina sp. TG20]
MYSNKIAEFPEQQISRQIKRITEFYLWDSYVFALDPTFRFEYLTPDEVTQFIKLTTKKLVHNLNTTFDEETLWKKQRITNHARQFLNN